MVPKTNRTSVCYRQPTYDSRKTSVQFCELLKSWLLFILHPNDFKKSILMAQQLNRDVLGAYARLTHVRTHVVVCIHMSVQTCVRTCILCIRTCIRTIRTSVRTVCERKLTYLLMHVYVPMCLPTHVRTVPPYFFLLVFFFFFLWGGGMDSRSLTKWNLRASLELVEKNHSSYSQFARKIYQLIYNWRATVYLPPKYVKPKRCHEV